MKAKDKIYQELLLLKRNQNKDGFTASELEPYLGIKRSVVSHYLNRLNEEGKLKKSKTRPVRYFIEETYNLPVKSDQIDSGDDVFKLFIGSKGSLAKQVEECKSAVLYPPNGLPIIIVGKSGVGKSYLASLIHQYAVEKGVIHKNAPFVVLNCADYANNPELLSATLFGYIKGAYTGATENKEGLLDQANGGYLFLDEIHRLSYENQEKLFIFLDKGIFRRLGENKSWNFSNVRFIFATTENIDEVLLETFRRRIPLTVNLPDLLCRPLTERASLIRNFYFQESVAINRRINILPEVLDILAFYTSVGNIGILKNYIKLSCANAYKVQADKDEIEINKDYLPIKSETDILFFRHSEIGVTVDPRDNTTEDIFSFNEVDGFRDNLTEFFRKLDYKNEEEVEEKILLLLNKIKRRIDHIYKDDLSIKKFIFNSIYKEAESLTEKYGIKFSEYHLDVFTATLIYFIYEHSDFTEYSIVNKIIDRIKRYHPKSFRLSEKLIFSIEKKFNQKFPLIHLFWAIIFVNEMKKEPSIQAIIVAHGKSTASSIASVANTLCENYIFEAFDMPISVKSETIIKNVNDYINQVDTSSGLILLVDMGSLNELYKPIRSYLKGDLLIINNITTSMAVDIGFKIKQNKSLQDIIENAKTSYETEVRYYEGIAKGDNIIVSCISGVGIAKKLKEIIEKYVQKRKIEILTFDYAKLKNLTQSSDASIFKQTKLIITTTDLDTKSIPNINVYDMIGNKGQNVLYSIFKGLINKEDFLKMSNEIIKFFSVEGVADRLSFLNPTMVINEVESIIKLYEEYYNIFFPSYIKMNLFMHISILIERLMVGEGIQSENKTKFTKSEQEFIIVTRNIFKTISEKYHIGLPTDEIMMIWEVISPIILSNHKES